MIVYVVDSSPAVTLAADELARCLGIMAQTQVQVQPTPAFDGQSGIYVGTAGAFAGAVSLPAVKDPNWDDAWTIRSVGDSLLIAGTNPRSTLIGAYEYLRMLGAEWLWPGEDGEDLPHIGEIPLRGFDARSAAASRHRGVCIEGAPALEHVLDMVEWLPRVGMNSYFLQFQVSSTFWRCWYEHSLNPTWGEGTELSESDCERLEERVAAAVKRRGLLLHRVGHGWTAAALGLSPNGWFSYDGELDKDTEALTAQVAGKRGLWYATPINTELCYSNPEARRRFVDAVLSYAREHPEVDVLHVWLSDAINNHCECEACSEMSPSDWYAMLLNDLSPRLKETAPSMKLAFLAYLDTLWPPTRVKLDLSHGNLVYMFAPISRCYGHRLADPGCGNDPVLRAPALNHVVMPRDNRDNSALLGLWKSARPEDSFAYDYHLMAIWLQDNITVTLADVIPQDLADYRQSGIGGIINCSTQRAFYPNGWAYYVMARSLWGLALGPEEKANYFRRAYGDGSDTAIAFFGRLNELSGAPLHRLSWWDAADETRTGAVLEFLASCEPELNALVEQAGTPAQRRACRLLVHYRELLFLLWSARRNDLAGDSAGAKRELRDAEEFLRETEKQTTAALDTYLMLQYVSGLAD